MFAQHAFEQIFATKYLIISKCNLVKMILVACDSYLSEGFKSTQSGLKCKETGWIFCTVCLSLLNPLSGIVDAT